MSRNLLLGLIAVVAASCVQAGQGVAAGDVDATVDDSKVTASDVPADAAADATKDALAADGQADSAETAVPKDTAAADVAPDVVAADVAPDVAVKDTAAADAGCGASAACGIGEFCNAKGNCCPALGCNPQCPNGPLLTDKGCDTCQCAPSAGKACNPLSMNPAAQCINAEYCKVKDGDCGSAQGTCTTKPMECAEIFQPVCGCGGKTFGNACEAATAGENIAATGECGKPGGLTLWLSCGYPVCKDGWQPTDGVPLCTGEKVGDACKVDGQKCDDKTGCGQMIVCAKSDPKLMGCPKSRARYKTDIVYLDDAARQQFADEILQTPVTTTCATSDHPQRQTGLAVPAQVADPAHDMVDLYRYMTMGVAALQDQQRQLDALLAQVRALQGRR